MYSQLPSYRYVPCSSEIHHPHTKYTWTEIMRTLANLRNPDVSTMSQFHLVLAWCLFWLAVVFWSSALWFWTVRYSHGGRCMEVSIPKVHDGQHQLSLRKGKTGAQGCFPSSSGGFSRRAADTMRLSSHSECCALCLHCKVIWLTQGATFKTTVRKKKENNL